MLAHSGKRLITDSESMFVLTRRESMRLLEMLENPPPRNQKFLEALARYRRIKDESDANA